MRQRFIAAIGGTLRFTPPQADAGTAPSAATVTIKRASSNTDLPTPVLDAAATVVGNDLTFALTGANCPDPLSTSGSVSPLYDRGGPRPIQPLYRAIWTYSIGTERYVADQLYEVRRRLLMPTLTVAELVRRLPATALELTGDATNATLINAIGDAWDDLLDALSAKGYEPDKIMDGDRLRSAHKALTIANLGRSWGPDWTKWTEDRDREFDQQMTDALTSDDWYDHDQSLTNAASEVKTVTIQCSR